MSDKVIPKLMIKGFLEKTGINSKISPYLIKRYKSKYQSCFDLSKFINAEISKITLNVNMIDSHV